MPIRSISISFLAGLAVATIVCLRYKPAPEVKTRTEYKRDVVTIIKEVTKPDGTTERETTITDNTERSKDKSAPVRIKPDFMIQGGVGTKFNGEKEVYTVAVSKRVFMDIFVGVYGRTDKELGVLVGLEF
jgi:hypothetical protein